MHAFFDDKSCYISILMRGKLGTIIAINKVYNVITFKEMKKKWQKNNYVSLFRRNEHKFISNKNAKSSRRSWHGSRHLCSIGF
ncbi:hypothetical protein GFB65_04100 [Enterococcus faecalis]|nr:hypothetical protein GFB65_04100 [Enterococcus faecalis]